MFLKKKKNKDKVAWDVGLLPISLVLEIHPKFICVQVCVGLAGTIQVVINLSDTHVIN